VAGNLINRLGGGYATTTITKLATEGVKHIGIQPKGQGAWLVAEVVRETIRSEGGKTAGAIATLKTAKYGCNRPWSARGRRCRWRGPGGGPGRSPLVQSQQSDEGFGQGRKATARGILLTGKRNSNEITPEQIGKIGIVR
jgi:hypothetical protein